MNEFLFTVCCPSCGTIVGKSFRGARTFTRCSKCAAELYYETEEKRTTVTITKDPKTLPIVPIVS